MRMPVGDVSCGCYWHCGREGNGREAVTGFESREISYDFCKVRIR
jgi:hypothetical protein